MLNFCKQKGFLLVCVAGGESRPARPGAQGWNWKISIFPCFSMYWSFSILLPPSSNSYMYVWKSSPRLYLFLLFCLFQQSGFFHMSVNTDTDGSRMIHLQLTKEEKNKAIPLQGICIIPIKNFKYVTLSHSVTMCFEHIWGNSWLFQLRSYVFSYWQPLRTTRKWGRSLKASKMCSGKKTDGKVLKWVLKKNGSLTLSHNIVFYWLIIYFKLVCLNEKAAWP